MIQRYRTPPGYRDTPFIYVFDPFTLIGNSNYPFSTSGIYQVCTALIFNQAVSLLYGERFILRRMGYSFMIVGPSLPSDQPGGIKLRDGKNLDRFSGFRPLTASDFTPNDQQVQNCNLPICPEIEYPVRSQMNFDLDLLKIRYSAQDGVNYGGPVPLSQLIFQGVRRFPNQAPDNRLLQDGWEERPYIYPIDINVNWFYWAGGVQANGQSPPVRFTIGITDWDFLLMDVRVLNDAIDGMAEGVQATDEVARITLYDWAQVALSNLPVNLHAMNSADTAGFTGAEGTPQPPGIGIGGTAGAGAQCPPLLYPNRSNIQFDITSMIQTAHMPSGGQTITIQFIGRRRWPKS